MTVQRKRLRRAALTGARAGVLGSAAMLTLAVWSFSNPQGASAATDGGGAQVVTPTDGSAGSGAPLTNGGSATPFTLRLPADAACTGDSANGAYRVQSYLVPSSVSPASLIFDFVGPVPQGVGASLRQPLYTIDGNPYVDQQTANATAPGGPGPVVNIPAFWFGVYVPGNVPAGTYNAGIACTKGTASSTQLDRYWNVQLVVVASTSDEPAGFTWTAQQTPTTTTTTSTTTPASSSTTTTTTRGTTTSTTAATGSTTTTSSSTTTTTTTAPVKVAAAAATAAPTGGAPASPTVASSVAELPRTGASTTSLVVWSLLLLVFGRMAVLLGRTPAVRPVA